MEQRILILDDDPMSVDTVALLVATLGYTAVRCSDQATAIQRIESEHFDLLLSDFDMPRCNGLEVVGQLRKRHIEIPVLLMSGDVAAIDTALADRLKVAEVLKKPFTVAELKLALNLTLSPLPVDSTRIIWSTVDGYESTPVHGNNSCRFQA